MFCKSAKAVYQNESLCLIHITDSSTPSVQNADKRVEVPGLPLESIMYARMLAYGFTADVVDSPVIFMDTDMLLLQPINIPVDTGGKTVLCRRSFNKNTPLNNQLSTVNGLIRFEEHYNQTMDLYPYLGCFVASSGSDFWKIAISIYTDLPLHYKNWYGDQVAIREAAKKALCVELLERQIACLPEALGCLNPRTIRAVHYKGNRKNLMSDHLSLLLASLSSQEG